MSPSYSRKYAGGATNGSGAAGASEGSPDALVSEVALDPLPELRGEPCGSTQVGQALAGSIRLEGRLHPGRVAAEMVLACPKRVTFLHQVIALHYESILEMPQHLYRAHSTGQHEVGAQYRIFGGHGVLQLGFCGNGRKG